MYAEKRSIKSSVKNRTFCFHIATIIRHFFRKSNLGIPNYATEFWPATNKNTPHVGVFLFVLYGIGLNTTTALVRGPAAGERGPSREAKMGITIPHHQPPSHIILVLA